MFSSFKLFVSATVPCCRLLCISFQRTLIVAYLVVMKILASCVACSQEIVYWTVLDMLVYKELATDQLPKRVYCESRRLLPESVVWLCANNRVAKAEQIIRNAAKLNNITMPDKILAHSEATDDDKTCDGNKKKGAKLLEKFGIKWNSRKSDKTKDGSASYTLLDIFRNRHLTINMFCMVLLWSVTSITT